MVRVLVTGVCSNVAQGIISGLREYEGDITIIGTSMERLCAGYFLVDIPIRVPCYDSEGYLELFANILKKEKVDYVFPGVDPEIPLLAKNRDMIRKISGTEVIVSDSSFVDQACDKVNTSLMLKNLKLPYPLTWIATEDTAKQIDIYPVIAKPRSGNASRGRMLIQSRSDMDTLLLKGIPDNYCFQEFLEGDEYTCGLLFDMNQNLKDTIIMARELDNTGTTVIAHILRQNDIQTLLEEFGKKVQGVVGSINIQLRLVKDRGPVIFEINPRFSGTTAFRVDAGYNDPLRLLLHLVEGMEIEHVQVENRCYFRYLTQIAVSPERVKNSIKDTVL